MHSDDLRNSILLARKKVGGKRSKPMNAWKHMIERCSKENCHAYKSYGGRGIKVCDRWKNFDNFFIDMGWPPEGSSLDRIDNNADYKPDNCRWASRKEQARNRRSNSVVEYDGRMICIAELSQITGISESALRERIAAGYSVYDSVTIPVGRGGRKLKPVGSSDQPTSKRND